MIAGAAIVSLAFFGLTASSGSTINDISFGDLEVADYQLFPSQVLNFFNMNEGLLLLRARSTTLRVISTAVSYLLRQKALRIATSILPLFQGTILPLRRISLTA